MCNCKNCYQSCSLAGSYSDEYFDCDHYMSEDEYFSYMEMIDGEDFDDDST